MSMFLYHCCILLEIKLTTTTARSEHGAYRAASHYLNQRWLVYWRIYASLGLTELTHWGRVTHICVSKLTIIGSDNGLSPGRRQANIWNNAGLLLIEPLGTNFSVISIGFQIFSFKEMHLNMSSAKWRPFCLGLNELIGQGLQANPQSFSPRSPHRGEKWQENLTWVWGY